MTRTHTAFPHPPSPGPFNRLRPDAAHPLFHACCSVSSYASAMLANRPFTSFDHVQEVSRATWNMLSPESWLAVFESHPGLTTRNAKHSKKRTDLAARWARKEAALLRRAHPVVLAQIRHLEEQYVQKHGFPVVLYLPGRTAEQVREEVSTRLANDTNQEIFEAAIEQVRITELRLHKALAEARLM